MSTNKEKILSYLKEETLQSINHHNFTFEKCNALILSMELYIDRTNVSRILNDLHKEGKLIKKAGRPTTFISREIIRNSFPFVSIPDTLNKNETISDFIRYDVPAKEQTIVQSFSIIGSQQNGSLYEAVTRILPVFYLPKYFFKIFFMQGEAGTGKKFFLEEMLNRAKTLGLASRESSVYYIEFSDIYVNLRQTIEMIEKDHNIFILAIEFVQKNVDSEILSGFVHSLQIQYKNKKDAPMIAFIAASELQSDLLHSISPVILNFPSAKDRPQSELISILLNMIQKESNRLDKTMFVSSQFIQLILHKCSNLHQLENEILYTISRILYTSSTAGKNNELMLDASVLFDNERENFIKSIPELKAEIPDKIQIRPNGEIEFDQLFLNSNEPLAETKNIVSDFFSKQLLICSRVTAAVSENSYSGDRLISGITKAFNKSVFCQDPFLKEKVEHMILSVFRKDKSLDIVKETPSMDIQTPQMKALLNNLIQLAQTNHCKLSKTQEKMIQSILTYAHLIMSDIHIPVIITSKYHLLASNYANIFNLFFDRRIIHTFPAVLSEKRNEKRTNLENLYEFAVSINRGQGVLILSDADMKQTITNYFFPKTKVLSYNVQFHSFILVKEILKLSVKKNASIISIIPNLLISQNDEMKILKDNQLKSYTLRSADKHLLFASKLTPGINTFTTNELFFRALRAIAKKLDIKLNDSLIFEFLFHANCILFQKKHNFDFSKNVMDHMDIDYAVLEVIQEKIQELSSPDFHVSAFTMKDYQILYEAVFHSALQSLWER